jgi:hypothetical protein
VGVLPILVSRLPLTLSPERFLVFDPAADGLAIRRTPRITPGGGNNAVNEANLADNTPGKLEQQRREEADQYENQRTAQP